MSTITVTALSVAAIKGTRLRRVDAVRLGPAGAAGDRRFFVIDERGRMQSGKVHGALQSLLAEWDEPSRELTVSFPDGSQVGGRVELGPEVSTGFFSGNAVGRLVQGPWSEAISEYLGANLRLVEAGANDDRGSAVDRGYEGSVSLISRGSLRRLQEQIDGPAEVDPRRFRMLVEVDGVDAHVEDGWIGSTVSIGEAGVQFRGNVGRCLVTGRDPETGVSDLGTLALLGAYRRELESTEPLPFGIYGRVVREGTVRVGDPVSAGTDSLSGR